MTTNTQNISFSCVSGNSYEISSEIVESLKAAELASEMKLIFNSKAPKVIEEDQVEIWLSLA